MTQKPSVHENLTDEIIMWDVIMGAMDTIRIYMSFAVRRVV